VTALEQQNATLEARLSALEHHLPGRIAVQQASIGDVPVSTHALMVSVLVLAGVAQFARRCG